MGGERKEEELQEGGEGRACNVVTYVVIHVL